MFRIKKGTNHIECFDSPGQSIALFAIVFRNLASSLHILQHDIIEETPSMTTGPNTISVKEFLQYIRIV